MPFYLVPEKYDFEPKQLGIDAAENLLAKILGKIPISYWESDEAQVVGLLITGTQDIVCPVCGNIETFDNPAVFAEMLFAQSAETIELEMPCCKNTVNLAQIDLAPNTKFSRFAFEVMSKNCLSSNKLKSISDVFGSKLLLIPFDTDA